MNLIKTLSFVILGLSTVLAQPDPGTTCPLYRCAASNVLAAETCIYVHKENVTVDGKNLTQTIADINTNPCGSGTNCPKGGLVANETCQANPPTTNVVGEACQNNINCYSGVCTNGVCQATANGASCQNVGECNVNYFCNGTDKANSICKEQVNIGGACLAGTDCVNNADCVNGNCTALFSLENGTLIGNNVKSHVCKSNQKVNNMCSDFNYLGPKGNYKTTGTDNVCNYTWSVIPGVFEIHQPGVCQNDGSLNGYCYNPGTNSDIWAQQTAKLTAWYNGPALQKNTIRRDSYTNDITLVVQTVTQWPTLNGADKCTIQLLTGVSSNAVLAKLSIALFGLLFFLF